MVDPERRIPVKFAVDRDESVFAAKKGLSALTGNSFVSFLVRSTGVLVFLVTGLFFIFIIYQSLLVFNYLSPSDLLFSTKNGEKVFEWYPVSADPKYSIIPLILGTIMTAIPATIISSIFGVGIGVYISEFAPPSISRFLKQIIDIFASLPTVAVGFILLTVGVTFFSSLFDPENRLNAFLSSVGLSLIIIPQIASLTEEALRGVPGHVRTAAYSLGAGRWETVRSVVFPAAVNGISASILLGFGRALGDTMIVLMTSGNAANISMNPFGSVRTMTATIAAELGEVSSDTAHFQTLFFLGMILFLMSVIINLLVKYLIKKFIQQSGGEVR